MRKKQIAIFRQMLLTALLLFAGLIFLFAPQNLTNKFQFAFARVFRWPLSIGRNISLSAHTQQAPENVVSRSKYNKLRNYLANIRQWLIQERQKVEKLSGLRDRPVWKGVNFVLAGVIASSGGSNSMLIIDRGKEDGLAEGQFVMVNYCVVGTISALDSRTARLKLVTDPTSKIAVKIAELSTPVVMQGDGNNAAKILLLPTKYKVEIGDIVYAQEKPGFLSTPTIVGKVAQRKRSYENPLLWDITIKPACDINRLKDVEVIVMNPQG